MVFRTRPPPASRCVARLSLTDGQKPPTTLFNPAGARRVGCEWEVRPNRRRAAEVYLGVVPLVLDAAGRLSLGGAGETVDWLGRVQRGPGGRQARPPAPG